MKRNIRLTKGFTLIEILVAATIMAVLTAIGIVSFSVANQKARNAKRKADLEQVRAALEIYRSDNPTYPAGSVVGNLGTITGLASYMTSASLSDPKDTPPYQYTYTPGVNEATYEVCAYLEPDPGTEYCLNSP